MKGKSTWFLKGVVLLFGMIVFTLCIWLPELASRDAKVHPDTASFLVPFLVCAYGLCITFLVVLYQVFKLLTYIDRNKAFSELSLKSLNVIKKCAFTVIFFIVLGITILKVLSNVTGDDPAGPISLGLMSIFATSIIAAIIDALQKPLKNMLELNPKNDLTV